MVGELTKGVEFLFKKNKIDSISGVGRILAPGKVEVKGTDGKTRSLTPRTSSSPPARSGAAARRHHRRKADVSPPPAASR